MIKIPAEAIEIQAGMIKIPARVIKIQLLQYLQLIHNWIWVKQHQNYYLVGSNYYPAESN